jgi:CRP-like cAMP-binding protein
MVSSIPVLTYLPKVQLRAFKRQDCMPLDKHRLWQIDSGIVRTATWDEDGTVITLGFWGPGDVVGQPLSRIEPYQIECLTDVRAFALPSGYQYPHRATLSHAQQTEELLKIMHSGSMEKRLLRFLSWLAQKFGRETNEGWVIDFRLTHQEIAEAISTTRVTVTRLLGKFEQDGMIEWSRQHHILLRSCI